MVHKIVPVALNGSEEVKVLLKSCKLLKHRIMNGLLSGCRLRTSVNSVLKRNPAD